MLQQYLDNLEATALIHDESGRGKWEQEFEVMEFLRDFLTCMRQHQEPLQSL